MTVPTIGNAFDYLFPFLNDPESDEVIEVSGCVPLRGSSRSSVWDEFRKSGQDWVTGYYRDPRLALTAACDMNEGWVGPGGKPDYFQTIYYTLQPVKNECLQRSYQRQTPAKHRTADADITRIENFGIDVDVERSKGIMASRAERAVGLKVARQIADWLHDQHGWPRPMICGSGNGTWLYYKLDGETTKENKEIRVRLLKLLGWKFGGEVDGVANVVIDESVANDGRLTKAIGTWSRLGENVEPRPWHQSNPIEIPDGPLSYLNHDDLAAVAQAMEDEKSSFAATEAEVARAEAMGLRNATDPIFSPYRSGILDMPEYLADAGVEVHSVHRIEPRDGREGGWRYNLQYCVFNRDHSPNEASIIVWDSGKIIYQCFHNSCKDKKWADAREILTGSISLARWIREDIGEARRIEWKDKDQNGQPLPTTFNVLAILKAYGFRVRYNEMTYRTDPVFPPAMNPPEEKAFDVMVKRIKKLMRRYRISPTDLQDDLDLIAVDHDRYHPVREWIESRPWDGVSRFQDLLATVQVKEESAEMWPIYLRKLLLQGVAALYTKDFSARGVLTFTGAQGAGKTEWLKRLGGGIRDAFEDGVVIDTKNKDIMVDALRHWISELGELDATFKKSELAAIKAFLTSNNNSYRLPYAYQSQPFRRQTVFVASVNDPHFLIDKSGNTRFWVVAVDKLDWKHDIDMQQVWAEARTWLEAGESWFLNEAETEVLNRLNRQYEAMDPLEMALLDGFEFESPTRTNKMTNREILTHLGFKADSRAEATQLGNFLKRADIEMVTMRGNRRAYLMPPRRIVGQTIPVPDEWLEAKEGAGEASPEDKGQKWLQ